MRTTDRVAGAIGNTIIAIEAVLFVVPSLVWWIPIWLVKWLHPRIDSLRDAEVLVLRSAARFIFSPVSLLLRRVPEDADACAFIVELFTAVIFWSATGWMLYRVSQ